MVESVILKESSNVRVIGSYFHVAASDKKGAILLGCAMGITQKYYKGLAEHFCEHGYEVLTFDFRGTGSSGPKHLRGFEANLFDWAEDIGCALEFLRARNEGISLIFIGHSISSQLLGFTSKNCLVDRVIFLASSTGYWRDGQSSRWKNLFLLGVVMPFSIKLWGYTNSRFFGQGENYPKGVSLQWRRWCFHPDYLQLDLRPSNDFFSSFRKKILSIYFTDDPIANKITAAKLLGFYRMTETELVSRSPAELKVKKVGHAGFLSRKMKANLWMDLLDALRVT